MWQKLKDWCKDSLTIAWARVQMAIGILLSLAASVDFTPVTSAIPQKWSGVVLVVIGVITEMARRRTIVT